MTKAEEISQRVIEQCLSRGVAEFVLCPGSRNSPLLAEAIRHQAKCWGHIDERAAGFFALGRCRALDGPVAVITTSGTAAFELFPAMIEALYQRLPLLVITADRPKRFRGSGAPQAIEQAGMFCVYAVSNEDSADGRIDLEGWDGWGPAHVNVCLEEPLVGDLVEAAPKSLIPKPWEKRTVFPATRRRKQAAPDVVLVGSLEISEREMVRKFLQELESPVVAEATSGLREDESLAPWLLRDGEHSVDNRDVRSVLRIGGVPSGRFWRNLENRTEVQVCVVLANGFRGLARDTLQFDSLDQLEFQPRPSVVDLKASRKRAVRLEELLREFPRSELALVRALSESVGAGSQIFLGNSLPIREWNLAATQQPRGLDCWGNRGANGIDGNLSSWLGWSAGNSGESWGLVGDLTALYDLNSLWVSPQLEKTRRRIAVLNNGGGGIFRRLPGLENAQGDLARVLFSEHDLGFEPWARMWGCGYQLWDGRGEICPDDPGTVICEVRPDAQETESFWSEWNRLRPETSAS